MLKLFLLNCSLYITSNTELFLRTSTGIIMNYRVHKQMLLLIEDFKTVETLR